MKFDHLNIVFFDGVCNLCNSTVDFLIRNDRKKKLRYAPLQGSTAQQIIPSSLADLSSIVYYRQGKVFTESAAVLRIVYDMGSVFKLAVIFRIVPTAIANMVYAFVAKRRYKWFGKKATCRMPSLEERALFLD